MKLSLCALMLFSSFFAAHAQGEPKLDGRWEGDIIIPGQSVRIIVVFRNDGGTLKATMDVPAQNAAGRQLANVRQTGSRIHFELSTASANATFDGEWIQGAIRGDFKQGDLAYKFELKRNAGETELPVSYRVVEVKVKSGEATLAGTLTLPEGSGPYPAVVLITDVGLQNRDEELYGFKGFKVLADALTTKGIAVLRCDDRSIGGSTGDAKNATTADLAADTEAQLRFLLDRKDIRPDRVGLLGHGEGATIAAMIAAKSKDVAFLVLMGASAVPGDQLILSQIDAAQRIRNIPAAARAEDVALQKRVFDAVRAGKSLEPIVDEVKAKALHELEVATKHAQDEMAKLPKEQQRPVPDSSKAVLASVDAHFAQARTPWFRYYIDLDPATHLAKVSVPVLAVFGELDSQAPTAINKPAMEAALQKSGNKDVTLKVFPLANHLFIQALSGSVEEYTVLPKVFTTTFPDTITSWVLKQVGGK